MATTCDTKDEAQKRGGNVCRGVPGSSRDVVGGVHLAASSPSWPSRKELPLHLRPAALLQRGCAAHFPVAPRARLQHAHLLLGCSESQTLQDTNV